jgi:hypothetical protein
MYLNEKEADIVEGILTVEFSNKDLVKLARSIEKIDFKCSDEELSSHLSINTLLTAVPKKDLLSGMKSARPDLSVKINNLLD